MRAIMQQQEGVGKYMRTVQKLIWLRDQAVDECEARGQAFMLGVFDEARLDIDSEGASLADRIELARQRSAQKKATLQEEIVQRVLTARKLKVTNKDCVPLMEHVVSLDAEHV